MNTEILVLKFANLLEVAHLSASSGAVYEKQKTLINLFREKKLPFLATMPMRHQYHCDKCNVARGESIHYFENPAVLNEKNEKHYMWGSPVGIWAQLNTRELHGVLAHNEPLNDELKSILESVNY